MGDKILCRPYHEILFLCRSSELHLCFTSEGKLISNYTLHIFWPTGVSFGVSSYPRNSVRPLANLVTVDVVEATPHLGRKWIFFCCTVLITSSNLDTIWSRRVTTKLWVVSVFKNRRRPQNFELWVSLKIGETNKQTCILPQSTSTFLSVLSKLLSGLGKIGYSRSTRGAVGHVRVSWKSAQPRAFFFSCVREITMTSLPWHRSDVFKSICTTCSPVTLWKALRPQQVLPGQDSLCSSGVCLHCGWVCCAPGQRFSTLARHRTPHSWSD